MNNKIWKNGLILFFASLLGLVSVTGCETTKGAGQDIEQAGEEMDEAIDD